MSIVLEPRSEASAARRLFLIDGHPDANPKRFNHALADSYADGALEAGHELRRVAISAIEFPILRTASHFGMPAEQEVIEKAQDDLKWADHVVIIFPIWLGAAPALLKAFLEQVARGGLIAEADRRSWRPKLVGKSARVIATTGLPAPIYHWVLGAHGVAALKVSFLNFAGISPVRVSLLGAMGSASPELQKLRLARVRRLGARAR